MAHLLSNVFPGGGVCCRRVSHFQRHHRAGLRYCGVGKFFVRTILVFVVCNCACVWSCVLANQFAKMKELADLSHCHFCKLSALCNNKGKIDICEIAGRQEGWWVYTYFLPFQTKNFPETTVQINWNCSAFSIFRGIILTARSELNACGNMAKKVNKDSPVRPAPMPSCGCKQYRSSNVKPLRPESDQHCFSPNNRSTL